MSAQSKSDYPSHWIKGQLLDLKRFADGSYRATLLGEEYDAQKGNALEFDSAFAAQAFMSQWYQPAPQRYG